MCKYSPKPKSLGANVKVELDLSNYATKADFKNGAGVDTLDFAKESDFANLKSDEDKLDIDKFKEIPYNLRNLKRKVETFDVDKLAPVPVDLSKPSDVVKMILLKKMYVMVRSKAMKMKYQILLT